MQPDPVLDRFGTIRRHRNDRWVAILLGTDSGPQWLAVDERGQTRRWVPPETVAGWVPVGVLPGTPADRGVRNPEGWRAPMLPATEIAALDLCICGDRQGAHTGRRGKCARWHEGSRCRCSGYVSSAGIPTGVAA